MNVRNSYNAYILDTIRNNRESNEQVKISQLYRRMNEHLMQHKTFTNINNTMKTNTKFTKKDMSISVDLLAQNAWEKNLMLYLDGIPFPHISKGEQSMKNKKSWTQ